MSDLWDEEDEELEEEAEQPKVTRRRRTRSSSSSNLYLVTGLAIGLAIGLVISLVIMPVKYIDTEPSSLSADYKDEYRQIIAQAYAANHDLGRARERVKLLGDANAMQALAAQAQRMLADKQSPEDARALAILASDLGRSPEIAQNPAAQTPSAQVVSGATSQAKPGIATITLDISAAVQTPTLPLPTATATATPPPTFTPRPTATPIRILDAPFTLKARREICDGTVPAGQLQLQVTGVDGKPLPGVRILITWQDGEDNTFYTGLAPEINPGYADFQMTPGVSYNLKVGDASEPLNGLKASGTCGWILEFTQEKGG